VFLNIHLMMLNVALRSNVVWRSLDSPVGLFTKMALCLGANVAAAFSKKMGASKQSVKAKPATMALSPKSVNLPMEQTFFSKLAAVGVAVSVMTTPVAALAEVDLELGEQVFTNNCAACHTGGGNTVKPGYTLEKDAINQYLETPVGNGLNVTAIIYQVQNGKNSMPAWADRLDEDEIDSVAAYVYDQSSNDKW